jgi:hypothetical protein
VIITGMDYRMVCGVMGWAGLGAFFVGGGTSTSEASLLTASALLWLFPSTA